MNNGPKSKRKSPARLAAEYLSLAMLLPSSVLAGYGIGWLLDRVFHTNFLYLVFLVLGAAAGFVELFRKVSRDTSDGL